MAKAKPIRRKPQATEPDLFAGFGSRRRRKLILPRVLTREADSNLLKSERRDKAYEIIAKWADLEKKGHLAKKETALDAAFLHEIFGDALGYKTATQSPDNYHLERNFSVPGVGTADGALGLFATGKSPDPVAMIELKDADADLDRDKFNGRTAVQQCWDYLKYWPTCPWGIISNYVTIRLYHRDRTPLAYQEFRLQELLDPAKFRQFWCLFEFGALLRPHPLKEPRALTMLQMSATRQREVGDNLYKEYSYNRIALIHHLQSQLGRSLDEAIHIAQKILDRIIFIAFCEDRELLPEKRIAAAYEQIPPFTKVTNPRWQSFLELFHAIDKGHKSLDLENGYNGGLFRHDPAVDDLQLDDSWTKFFNTIGTYDFRDEINVDVLGHIFEKSVGELKKMRLGGLFVTNGNGNGLTVAKKIGAALRQQVRFVQGRQVLFELFQRGGRRNTRDHTRLSQRIAVTVCCIRRLGSFQQSAIASVVECQDGGAMLQSSGKDPFFRTAVGATVTNHHGIPVCLDGLDRQRTRMSRKTVAIDFARRPKPFESFTNVRSHARPRLHPKQQQNRNTFNA